MQKRRVGSRLRQQSDGQPQPSGHLASALRCLLGLRATDLCPCLMAALCTKFNSCGTGKPSPRVHGDHVRVASARLSSNAVETGLAHPSNDVVTTTVTVMIPTGCQYAATGPFSPSAGESSANRQLPGYCGSFKQGTWHHISQVPCLFAYFFAFCFERLEESRNHLKQQ